MKIVILFVLSIFLFLIESNPGFAQYNPSFAKEITSYTDSGVRHVIMLQTIRYPERLVGELWSVSDPKVSSSSDYKVMSITLAEHPAIMVQTLFGNNYEIMGSPKIYALKAGLGSASAFATYISCLTAGYSASARLCLILLYAKDSVAISSIRNSRQVISKLLKQNVQLVLDSMDEGSITDLINLAIIKGVELAKTNISLWGK